jgi:hypothetical protein
MFRVVFLGVLRNDNCVIGGQLQDTQQGLGDVLLDVED